MLDIRDLTDSITQTKYRTVGLMSPTQCQEEVCTIIIEPYEPHKVTDVFLEHTLFCSRMLRLAFLTD
jgi:hypothetical protein